MSREQRCETCWYAQKYWAFNCFVCHLRGPVYKEPRPHSQEEYASAFPIMAAQDWCGEWRPACTHLRAKGFEYDSDGKIATEHSCPDCDARWTTFAMPAPTVSEGQK